MAFSAEAAKNPFEIKGLPTELALCIHFFAGKLGFETDQWRSLGTFSPHHMCFLRNKSTQRHPKASWKLRRPALILPFCSPEKKQTKTSFGALSCFRIRFNIYIDPAGPRRTVYYLGESRAPWRLLSMAFNSKPRDYWPLEVNLVKWPSNKKKMIGKEPKTGFILILISFFVLKSFLKRWRHTLITVYASRDGLFSHSLPWGNHFSLWNPRSCYQKTGSLGSCESK